ncbi:MAG TPA: DUF4465 domain-containing protein [Isosphaeraceae bacterium]|jgi:hypothetical protein|nr:DUF4465 domain-containing protein [Isosphaeraceae bacterium]
MSIRFRPLLLALALLVPAAARADINVDFEDLSLPPNSFNNGSDLAGGFTSRGASFNNAYDPTFGDWSGWSYSNVHDTSATPPDFSHEYAAITGSGVGGSGNYGIAYAFNQNDAFINLPAGASPTSVDVTNTTYAYDSMLLGDQFSKKFTTGDFFTLKIFGYSGLNATGNVVGEVDFDLARYTSPTDHPLNTWAAVDLSKLAGAASLGFGFVSSDVGPFGINTPTFVAIDDLHLRTVPEPASALLLALGALGLAARRGRHD